MFMHDPANLYPHAWDHIRLLPLGSGVAEPRAGAEYWTFYQVVIPDSVDKPLADYTVFLQGLFRT